MPEKKILVLGASGPVGSALVRELSAAGVPVIAAVQTQEEASSLKAPYVETFLVYFEAIDPALALLKEADRVVFALPPVPSYLDNVRKAVETAKRAGVKQFVYLSSFLAQAGDRSTIARLYADAEKAVRSSGLPWTILRPRALMQAFLSDDRAVNGRLRLPYGRSRVSFVDARDVAVVAQDVLTTEGHLREIYNLTGGEALSAKEVSSCLSKAAGKIIGYQEIDLGELERVLKEEKVPAWKADLLLAQHSACREGLASSVTGAVQLVTGRKPMTLTDFAAENAQAL